LTIQNISCILGFKRWVLQFFISLYFFLLSGRYPETKLQTGIVMITFLVVDDHDYLRFGVTSIINANEDYRVVGEARDGATAIKLARESKPDIIIMDLGLGKDDGITISAQILKETPGIKIIALTVYREVSFIERAMKAGLKGYVSKNSIYSELLNAIQEVIKNRIYLCEESRAVYYLHQEKQKINIEKFNLLTEREKYILVMIAESKSLKLIAEETNLSEKTISTHKTNIMNKVGAENFTQLLFFCIRNKIIKDKD
jgi:DNA-binding NarL/FixJ family response regulator